MGSGSYTASDWDKLRGSRKITTSSNERELFTTNKFLDKFNPKFIDKRESRDNDEHPNSTPIAIGLDVTGSMGYLPTEIIKNGLNELMKKLYSSQVIPDPQLMFAAIGDVHDDAPLQVTQFESDIRIAEQLLELWIEGQGGDIPEDYSLLWYFLAKHTDTDSMKKRNKKGYAFTIGDAPNHASLFYDDIKAIFNDNSETLSKNEIITMCQEKYNLFHIDIGHYGDHNDVVPCKTIRIDKSQVDLIPEIIITVICRIEGVDSSEILGHLDKKTLDIIDNSLKYVQFDEVINF